MLGDELRARDIYAKKQNAKWEDAMAEINAYLETHTRADTVKYADEHGIKISEKDRKLAKKEVRHQARNVDKNTSKRYNRNRTPYNSFATEAMKWAYSDRTAIGEQKFLSRNDKWVLLEKSNDGYVEMGSYTNKQRETLIEEIIARNEEIHNRRRDGEIRADIDGYRNVKGEYSRYFTDDMGFW